ncbi:MAG: 3-oxoacyl-ACP reductase FabG [Lachnospiraceae bacterium]|nr:3-oxoacyl-ACP reductase FabG [Lachnospiraceae bacterium]
MLKGKVAIVTGGTRGIGLAVVKKFLDNGAIVVLCGSREETVNKALAEIKRERPEAQAEGAWPDLASLEQVQKMAADVYEKYGKIDILVNNAGISARDSIYQYTEEEFDKIMNLNIKAVFNCTRAVVGYMKEQKSGAVINTSSVVSIYGQAAGCGYPASKFAVNGLTKSLARELGADNIRVNAVAPGVTRTDMVAALPKEMAERVAAGIPLGRVGEPEEVADAFLFLASNMASYISGEILSVDGAVVI